MKTDMIRVNSKNKKEAIARAAELIKRGELVAFPTETVYGLGADAFNESAVKKIFAAKGRPSDNPLIVHICNLKQLDELVESVPPQAKKLMEKFWPGPLTIVLKKSSKVPLSVTAGLDTVAIRMPLNRIALELIKKSGCPIAAPSANTATKPSPTAAKHVLDDMNGKIPLILDGGDCSIGVESTVIGLYKDTPILFRPGKVTLEELEKVLGKINCAKPISSSAKDSKAVPQSPGMKYRHYSPKAEVILIEAKMNLDFPKKVSELSDGKNIGVISFAKKAGVENEFYLNKDLDLYAKNLFYAFRELDSKGVELIIAEGVNEEGIGRAIMNRLRKASSKII